MPQRVGKPCNHAGCPEVVTGKPYCEKHRKQVRRNREQGRASSTSRGYGSRWQKARKIFLRAHPLCAYCKKEGRTTAAQVVDHIIPHKGNDCLMWDESNWQPLCKRHHDIKTATEDGGFGRT